MPTTVPITRARRLLILAATVAFGAFLYVVVDFGGISDAVDANAELNELMAASQAVHRIAETPRPASAGDLGGAIIRMRTAHAAAFDNVGGVLGDLRTTTAESTVGARLAAFEDAARDYRANVIDAGSLDAAYYAVVDELDSLLLAVSTVSAGEAARMRTLLLVAGVATALATTVLLVGLRFWRRSLIESVQQLRASDERFRRSLDNAADAVVITDSEMKVIYANAAACRLSGYDLDAVLGRVYSEFWVDFDLDAKVAADQLNVLGAVRFTRDSRRADGTIITVEHDVIALGDGTFLGVAHDATERLKTQAALVESEQRFRTVIDTMQNALVIIDEERRPIMVNHALAEMLGYRESEILAFDQANFLVHPDTRGLLVELSDRVRTGELGPTPFRARLIKKDGGAVDVDGLLSQFILEDGSRAVLAEAKDVTEQLVAQRGRREAVHEVRLGEARLSRAQQIAHIGSWELDFKSGQVWWSDEQFRLVGLEPQSVEPSFELLLSFVHPDDRDRVRAAMDASLESGDPVDAQYRIVREDGEERIVRGHGEIVRGQSGEATTAQGTTRDVTEDVRVREELAEAQKLQAVGTLAAGIAHDFNNLLTVIGGHLTLALDGGDPPSPALLEPAKRASDRASELARQLLEFARSGAINRGEALVVVDVRELARDAAAMVRLNLDPRVTLHADIDGRPLFAAAEQGALDRVCMNLLLNARDALVQQAAALDDDSYRPRIDLTLRALEDGREIELTVADNGTGMTEAVRVRVFEPFFSTKNNDQSTGLGLATTYGIVTHLGGAIDVVSEPGVGTTFTVRIPIAPAMQDGPQAADAADPTSARLLLVDDEEDLLSFAAAALERSGYETVSATSGPAALQSAAGETFDLVLLDVNLGEMDGWEVLHRLHDRDPAQRVLMWSGVAGHDEAMRRGAVGLLPKPFDSRKLLDAIAEALRAASSTPAEGTNGR